MPDHRGGPSHPALVAKPWDQLDARTKRQVQELISSLSEVEAALQHMNKLAPSIPSQNHPLGRFMSHGLVAYQHGLFVAGPYAVKGVLLAIGLEKVARAVEELLSKPVGAHTLRSLISEQRNTSLAHPSLDPKDSLKRLYDKADLEDDAVLDQFRGAHFGLMDATRIIHAVLRRNYPIAAAEEDARWKPVERPPAPES